MNATNAKNVSADMNRQRQLVKDFKAHPNDPDRLIKLVKSLDFAGKHKFAADFLKKIILDNSDQPKSNEINQTAFKCLNRVYLNCAIKMLNTNDKKINALRLFADLIKFMQENKVNPGKENSNISKMTFEDKNMLLNVEAAELLVSRLLRKKETLKAFELLGLKECIVSYPTATHVMQKFLKENLVFKLPVLSQQAKMVNRFLDVTKNTKDKNSIIIKSMYSNTFYPLNPWREKILSHYNLEDMKKIIKIEGLEILNEYAGKNRGVILVSSHMSTGRALNMILDHMGFKINALEARDRLGKFGIRKAGNLTVFELGEKAEFPLRQLYLIQKALKKGEIANLSGDGYLGKSGIELDFLGRRREFKTSFAEIALNTGSVALPVLGSAHPSGTINIKIKQPLDSGTDDMKIEDRINSMVKQYATMLEEIWKLRSGDIAWEQIKYYLGLPEISNNENARSEQP